MRISHTLAINHFPNKPWFLRVCSTSLLKSLWEKEKLLIWSNFSFSHSVIYPFRRTLCHFHQLQNCGLQNLSVWKSLKFVVWEKANIVEMAIDSLRVLCSLITKRCFGIEFRSLCNSNFYHTVAGNNLMQECFLTLTYPNKPWFSCVCSTSLLKTRWEKEKMLFTSNFSFTQCFFLFGELSAILIKFIIVVCKLFQFGRV